MDISITDITDVEKEISIHASAGELEPHFEKAYKRYAPTIEIKGFRKGKSPMDLVKKLHRISPSVVSYHLLRRSNIDADQI